MGSKDKTKIALLDAGKRIFSEKGYTASGIEAVLQEAGVPLSGNSCLTSAETG